MKVKKIASIFICWYLVLFSAVIPVSAQDIATPSANVATPSGVPDNFPVPESSASSLLTPEITAGTQSASLSSTIQPTLTETPTPPPSANIKYAVKIRNLPKKYFRAQEQVRIDIDNFDATSMQVMVRDSRGNSVTGTHIHEQTVGTVTTFVLTSDTSFTPGKYSIIVSDGQGGTQVQDFYWGVLAINPDKSIYSSNDTAHIAMAVLSEKGDVVCDAHVTLTITDPEGKTVTKSTDDETIRVNQVCHDKSVTAIPDYETDYNVGGLGHYALSLSALTANGTFTLEDGFDVRDDAAFDVVRDGPTRIYPPNFYPMQLHVTANTDFTGDVVETVPQSFTISQIDAAKDFDSVSVVAPIIDSSSYFVHLRYPFDGTYPISLRFGEPLQEPALIAQYKQFGLVGHDGVDFALSEGTPVLAADEGTVILAGEGAYGQTVVLQHTWGRSYYGHLSTISVQLGDKVMQGQEIGLSGHTGLVTGPHLHFGIKLNTPDMTNGYYGKTDPLPYLMGTAVAGDTSVKHITWHVSMKKGDIATLGYQFQAPNISPQFYLLGPLTLTRTEAAGFTSGSPSATGSATLNPFVLGVATGSASLQATESAQVQTAASQPSSIVPLFSESRQWQIAADALGTLYPAADVAIGAWLDNGGGSSNIYLAIDEGTSSPNDTDYVQCGISCTNDDYDLSHTTSPSDVGTVTAFTVNFRGQRSKNKATSIDVFYCTGAGCSPTTAIGTTQTMTSSWALYSVSATGLSLTKAQIDTLKIRFRGNATGGAQAQVSAEQVDITYTTSGPTTDQQMRHGNWFSGGVEQSFTF